MSYFANCLVCGKYLANVEITDGTTDWYPVCIPCFTDKIGKPIESKKLVFPDNWREL